MNQNLKDDLPISDRQRTSKVICKFLDHRWVYNFQSAPNKRICQRCKQRQQLNLATYEWNNNFYTIDSRTDEELIQKWVAQS